MTKDIKAAKSKIARNRLAVKAALGELDFRNTELVGEDFSGWYLFRPKMSKTVFRDCNLQYATIFEAESKDVHFIGCDCRRMEFIKCHAEGAGFVSNKMHKANLSLSDISNGRINECVLTGLIYTGLQAPKTNWDGSTLLSGKAWGGVNLCDAAFDRLTGISDAPSFLGEKIRQLAWKCENDVKMVHAFKFLHGLCTLSANWFPAARCWQEFLDLGFEYYPEALEIFLEAARANPVWRTRIRIEAEEWKRNLRLRGEPLENRLFVSESGDYRIRTDELGAFRPTEDLDPRKNLYVCVDETFLVTERHGKLDPDLEELRAREEENEPEPSSP